ncbi:MAG: acVLRF1 family peptidyl-tRNA hydrolase [Marmoricola sp.]
MSAEVVVPAERLERWVGNFIERHGDTRLDIVRGALAGAAADGSTFAARAPFDRAVGHPAVARLAAACTPPTHWGVLLVRKGGFAVARMEGVRMVEHKVGQRHVQGRTKAGGQSQQRFARRRDNQARAAYAAAAGHAARILHGVSAVVVGGDPAAIEAVLADPRLRRLGVVGHRLDVPDPRRAVLDGAVREACSARVSVRNADDG